MNATFGPRNPLGAERTSATLMQEPGFGSFSLHGISRHVAPRPLPLTHPFSLKSNCPIILPS